MGGVLSLGDLEKLGDNMEIGKLQNTVEYFLGYHKKVVDQNTVLWKIIEEAPHGIQCLATRGGDCNCWKNKVPPRKL